MFELSIACKYLLPRWRQLSVSIIALISVLVIALVVWLVLIFLSVTDGIESNWITKLVSLNGAVQVSPTQKYYESFYYRIDSVSSESDYAYKTLKEKLQAERSNPYDPDYDAEIPEFWPIAKVNDQGEFIDPVKLLNQTVNEMQGFPGLRISDFELAMTQMRLRLLRDHDNSPIFTPSQTDLNSRGVTSIISSFDPSNHLLSQSFYPPSAEGLSNLLFLLSISAEHIKEDSPSINQTLAPDLMQARISHFFTHATIHQLKVPPQGWRVPLEILPENGSCTVTLFEGQYIILGNVAGGTPEILRIENKKRFLKKGIETDLPIIVPENTLLDVTLKDTTITSIQAIPFHLKTKVSGLSLEGDIRYGNLTIGSATATTHFKGAPEHPPLWVYSIETEDGETYSVLPSDPTVGDGVLLAQGFKEKGAYIGDRGFLAYSAVTPSAIQEQRLPIYIAGFYNSGVMPIGNKLVIVNDDITSLVRSSLGQHRMQAETGYHIWLDDVKQVDALKERLQEAFHLLGIEQYWEIETYKDYDFSKNLVQQFQSDKNLLTLIAIIIILVACSNIISMLIILVNDKKKEIGILVSMGATPWSIASIFGFCGVVMGLFGSILGIVAAYFTLKNLQFLVDLVSSIQGFEVFNAAFYGDTLPTTMSVNALSIVLFSTVLLSLIAGMIPAYKATRLRPAEILRSE